MKKILPAERQRLQAMSVVGVKDFDHTRGLELARQLHSKPPELCAAPRSMIAHFSQFVGPHLLLC